MTGSKIPDDDDSVWDDYDAEIQGSPYGKQDDPDYEDGFIWSCCSKKPWDEGCKKTRHKCADNVVTTANPFKPQSHGSTVPQTPKKDFCKHCKQKYSPAERFTTWCTTTYHPGDKTVDYDAEIWAEHDEDCHGPMDMFIDDPLYKRGMMWECCELPLNSKGCEQRHHEPRW